APTKVVMPTEGAGEGGGGRGTFPGEPGQAGRRGAIVRVTSPDGTWVARTQEKPQPKTDLKYASDFEQRHQERFKGAIFDWKDFQRDGAPFPAPNPAALPALQIVLQPASGNGDSRTIVDMDLRPANLPWHPTATLIAFPPHA